MNCYLYINQSIKNDSFYIGSSYNPQKRLLEHNNGQVRATRNKGPWVIKFTQKYINQKKARQIEYKLKKLKRRDIIERIIIDGYIKIE